MSVDGNAGQSEAPKRREPLASLQACAEAERPLLGLMGRA